MTVAFEDVVLARGSQVLIDGLSTVIGNDSCIGIFGPNGCGKSTLLQAILGELPIEAGRIDVRPVLATVGYVPQLRDLPPDATVREVLRKRTGVADAEARLAQASRRLEVDASAAAGDAFNDALNRFISLGVDSLEDRAPTVLADLGCEFTLDRLCAGLSGGELARVGLAGILLSQYDVLLLDEPTNDLDAAGIRSLTDFVTSRTTPVLLVSHDRRFLEATITGVLEFDPSLDRVVRFEGGYRSWQEERERARIVLQAEHDRFETDATALRQQADASRQRSAAGTRSANRAYASGRIDKLQRGAMREGATSEGSAVKAIERKLDRLNAPDQVRKVWSLKLEFPSPARAGAFTLDSTTAKQGDFELGPLSVSIAPGQRVRIAGPNGSGKSMLVDLLVGRLSPAHGRASVPPVDEIGLLDQQRSVVPLQDSNLVEWFPETSDLPVVEARTLLAKFGLGGDDVNRPMNTLSPGERTRAGLALLSEAPYSALVLDEPTNHLDLPAIEQLEQALVAYRGTLIVVTHDEEFAERISFDQHVQLERH